MKGRDHQGLTNMSEDIDTRLSEEQKMAVRRLCCANAVGDTLAEQVADAEELMMAAGVHPRQIDDDEDEYRTRYPESPNSSNFSTPPRRLRSL
jgi:hypothetical protein